MLNMEGKTKIVESKEFGVASSSGTIGAEGLAVVQAFEDGVEKIKVSAGVAKEVFMGFSYGSVFTPVNLTVVESLVVPEAPFQLTLLQSPVGQDAATIQMCVISSIGGELAWEAYNAVSPPPTGQTVYQINGKTLILGEDEEGGTLTVTYKYAPTASELLLENQVRITSFSGPDYIGSIGCIQHGEVYTDMYDAQADWAAVVAADVGDKVFLGADGAVTDTNSGTAGELIPNCVVCHVPTQEIPYLGLRF